MLWGIVCVITVKVVNMNVIWFASGIVNFRHFVPCDLIHVSQLNLKNCVMLKKWVIQEIGIFQPFLLVILF